MPVCGAWRPSGPMDQGPIGATRARPHNLPACTRASRVGAWGAETPVNLAPSDTPEEEP